MEIRWALPQDRPALDELWYLCFGDDQSFRSWFFENRFLTDNCLAALEEGRIIGAVYGLPLHLRLRGRAVPCSIIGGVSTHPDRRGRGVMRALFTRFMADLHSRGVPCGFLHPVVQELYFPFGFYTSCDRGFLTLDPGPAPVPAARPLRSLAAGQGLDALYRCYCGYAAGYSGPVSRSWPDFVFKYGDYLAGGGRCAVLPGQGGAPEGYCIYFTDEHGLYGEECAALTPGGWQALAEGMAALAAGRGLTLKLPPDHLPALPGARTEVKPWGAMGAACLPALLPAVTGGPAGFALRVTDPVVAGNNGVFGLDGLPACAAPQLTLEAGRLVQWLTGYRSLAALAAEGLAHVHDPAAAARLDRLYPTLPCVCSDEY